MILNYQCFELDKKTILERVVFKPPLQAVTNMHDEACLLYPVRGTATLYGATEKQSLSTGQGVVMKCGNYVNHWQKVDGNEPCEAIAIHFNPEVLKQVYSDGLPEFLTRPAKASPTTIHSVKMDQLIDQYMQGLKVYFDNESLIDDDLLVLKVKELIQLLIKTDDSEHILEILRSLFNPVEYQFKEVIHTHLLENLSVEEFAVLTDMSVSTFKRKFNEVFGESPARYIRTKRLEKAAEMLRLPHLRISDVCYDCGFNDVTHFSKAFSAHFGTSPSDYRESVLS